MIIYGVSGAGRIYRNEQEVVDESVRDRKKATVLVTDLETGEKQEFLTMQAVADHLKCSHSAVRTRCRGKVRSPYNGRYVIKMLRES